MANTGVKGRIIDTDGAGIPGLEIVAVDFDPFVSEEILRPLKQPGQPEGLTLTDANGNFIISYTPDQYQNLLDRNPDLVIRVYAPGMRLLLETEEFLNVKQPILDIGTRTIHKNNVEGWLVTNATLDPKKGDPVFLTKGNQLEWLIDGAALFPELTKAVKNTQESLNLMNMMFRVDSVITNFKFKPGQSFDTVQNGDIVEFERLQDLLLVKATEVSPVNVLVWDAINDKALNFILDKADTADEVTTFFQDSLVETRAFEGALTFMHAKALIKDGKEAFVAGSTLSQGYFSDGQHLIHDIRHGGSLMHDVSARVTGPAVTDVDRTFVSLWNAARSSIPMPRLSPAPRTQPPPGNPPVAMQVLRTLPGGRLKDSLEGEPEIAHGETGILEAYQRAISLAEDVIYIEDQYFVSPEIANALLHRMKQVPKLEVILVLNPEPDIPGYPQKQIQILNQMRATLGTSQDRLGAFTLWSCDDKKKPFEIMPIYIHSKTGIVDERWATVGTANIDGASLNQLQTCTILPTFIKDLSFFKKILTMVFLVPAFLYTSALVIPLLNQAIVRPTQHADPLRSKQPPRFVELNVAVYNGVAGMPQTDLVTRLRDDLWREHLGVLPATRPPDGWVKFWEKQADDKLKAINARKGHPAKILKWVPKINRREYLETLGVSLNGLRILKNADRYDFVKLKWIFGEEFKD